MKTLRLAMLALALVIGATATSTAHAQQTPPAPKPAFDGAGQYELQITFGGQSMPIFLELIKDKDAWRGSAGNPNLGTANVAGVKVDGRTLKIDLVSDGASFFMTLTVKDDNTVEGKWEGNGDGSAVTGKKTK